MVNEREVGRLEDLLRLKRDEFDFPAQLSVRRELGRVLARQGDLGRAADMVQKAAKLAEYLDERNEMDSIFRELIAIHEGANDVESALAVYGLLHILWTQSGDLARAAQYNNVRLELVARQIGKKAPSFQERLAFEAEASQKVFERDKKRLRQLVSGEEEPTFPDEHVEACDFLACTACVEGRFDEALRWIAACEVTIGRLGPWTTDRGKDFLHSLEQRINRDRRDADEG